MRLYSWNVNGVRAALRKGLLNWFDSTRPDVLCLQEVRAEEHQIEPAMLAPLGYHSIWNPSRAAKGYSGTAILSREPAREVELGLGDEEFDVEGRTVIAHFDDFVLLNAYFPNGRNDLSRVDYKLRFYELFLARCEEFRAQGRRVVFCGDLNTAHMPIDLARPKQNVGNTGFLPEERAWIDRFCEAGYVDTWRALEPETADRYTWWAMRMGARERNVGWRLDYFFVDEATRDAVRAARIHDQVTGSDHCPVELELEFDQARPRRHR
ncbi:exodeoxyribonuclease III [bacterium]|nr:MAG: exodeoxyribonuclease III [bacterium]RKZ15861.1 MAG: exodeoxyribonuclease III [bacterium]